jgi:hypothetical protein
MNKTASFFLAPITSIFSREVYQEAAKASAGRGVLYVLYWAFLTAFIAAIIMGTQVLPRADAFVQWFSKEMPVVIWTPEGISLENGQSAATISHPSYGPIAILDMKKTTVTEADMGQAYFFLTATKVFMKKAPGAVEERDITKAGIKTDQQLPARVRITGELAMKLYQTVKKVFLAIIPLMVFIASFFVYLIGNLFYSVIGILLNLARKSKLRYGLIFTLTCFCTGVSLTLMWFKALTPLRAMPWPLWVSVLINLIYMFFAFRITDSDSAKA